MAKCLLMPVWLMSPRITPSAEIASEHQLHWNLVTKWKQEAIAELPLVFGRKNTQVQAQQRKVAQLYEQIGRPTTQVNWLKRNPPKTRPRTCRLTHGLIWLSVIGTPPRRRSDEWDRYRGLDCMGSAPAVGGLISRHMKEAPLPLTRNRSAGKSTGFRRGFIR